MNSPMQVSAQRPLRPTPSPTDLTAPYWAGAKRGELLIQRCTQCQRHQFYPRSFCMHCMGQTLDWVRSSGLGHIYTFTINRRGANAFMAERTPYAVAIIELEEGVRLMANIIDASLDDIAVGKPVKVAFEAASDDITLPQFQLVEVIAP